VAQGFFGAPDEPSVRRLFIWWPSKLATAGPRPPRLPCDAGEQPDTPHALRRDQRLFGEPHVHEGEQWPSWF
jgi:hypothetical protein